MTRLIDADALTKQLLKVCGVPSVEYLTVTGKTFARLIATAPTIEQPTGDLISRQAAIEAIRKSAEKYAGFMEMEQYTDNDAVDAIKSLPSAPDSRQRGEWVWDEDAVDWGIGAWCCSECGSVPQTWWSVERNKNPLICAGSRFCGNCGARMNGGKE